MEPFSRELPRGLAVVRCTATHGPGGSRPPTMLLSEMFPSVFAWLGTDAPASLIMYCPTGGWSDAVLEAAAASLDGIRVVGDDPVLSVWTRDVGGGPDHALRVARRPLANAPISCSGACELALSVHPAPAASSSSSLPATAWAELVVVDPDAVEDKNLNRILNSTAMDAADRANKAKVPVRSAPCSSEPGYTFGTDLLDRGVIEALSTCDVLFRLYGFRRWPACAEQAGQHAHVIPLIDIGVRLDADGNGGIDSIWLAVHAIAARWFKPAEPTRL